MKMINMALGRVLLFVFFVASGAISEQRCAYAASMSDYCIVPPSMAVQAKPNVNILMDYSGSMQLPAYIPCSIDETYENGALQCGVGEGVSYDATKNYYGYFNGEAYYEYGSSRFSAKPGCSAADRIGSSGCISGNLLNWITSTRIDTVRKALVGGRTSTGKNIVLESEGAMLTYTDTNLGCTFSIEAPSVGNRVLSIADGSGKTCPLGTLGKGAVKIDGGSSTPSGIIDKFFPKKMDLEFSIFKTNDAGLIRAAKNPAKSSLVAAIGNEQPAGATPTGEALWEAYDFLRQSDDHIFESNNDQIKPGNDEHDPYYSASSPVTCRKSFVLLISDGPWNGDVDPAIPAHALRTVDLRTLNSVQQGAVFVIHAFGDKNPQLKNQGRNALITTAIFGGFRDRGTNDGWPFPFTKYAAGSSGTCADFGETPRSNIEVGGTTICNSRGITYPLPACSPSSWNVACSEWGRKSDGLPYNFFDAEDGYVLEKALEQAFNSILTGLASGTSVSMVNNNTGSGAALLQAMFYPNRRFEGEELAWTGELRSLWYYIDPFLEQSSIREETGYSSGNHTLDLVQDNVLTFDFDKDNGKTTMYRWSDSQGNGKSLVSAGTVTPEAVGTNWRAGELLRNTLPADRTIMTSIDGDSLINFTTSNANALSPFMAVEEPAELISYIRGQDNPDATAPEKYRSRSSTIDGASKVWKLGDIISSSPKAQSPMPLNIYHLPNPNGYGDQSYADFVGSTLYKDHQSVYVGANDGMLHAFKLGLLRELNKGTQKASLSGSGLGREAWAYIPKGTLPYLKHLSDPLYDHLYYVDGPLRIFDAAIHAAVPDKTCSSDTYWECNKKTTVSAGVLNKEATSWRTILIGGMGIGGAVRAASSSCSATEDCVKTPAEAPAGAGYSSYFALDVTDDAGPPQLLWEFYGEPKAPGTLGFSTSEPAVVRVGDKNKNGRWFAIFGSGPTGPIDVSSRQFLGRSDQNLRLFVVDIATGKLITTIDADVNGKPLAEKAFAASLAGSAVDTDRWNAGSSGFYSDDAVYIGYVQKAGSGGWTKGGVLRLATKNSSDPKQWVVTRLIDGIGPVTTSVAKLQDRKNRALWVFFGTGRYFYKTTDAIDSPDEQQAIYGVRDPCYTTGNIFSGSCTDSVKKDDLTNQTDNPSNSLSSLGGSPAGWIIHLDGTETGGMKAERVITDPVAAHNGAVFFTTFRPNDNPCGYGGDSYVWAVRYDTGGVAPAAALKGKALVQVSTGALTEVNLAGDLGAQEGRRTSTGIPGMPPAAQGLTILARPKPAKKLLHVQER